MDPVYRVDLGRIMEDLGEQLDVSADIELGDFTNNTQEFGSDKPAHVDMTLTNTGAGVVGHGSVGVALATECSRCLKPFTLDVRADVDAFYVLEERSHELPEEQEYELITDHAVDLIPALRSAITLELPFAPVHDPDCAGICPTCGVDLNEGECDCRPEGTESPFAALSGLFADDSEDS